MALSYAYRQAIKYQTLRWRRLQVVAFFLLMAMGLTEGGHRLTWDNVGALSSPYIWSIIFVFFSWRRRGIPVSSLDDRAMSEHGVEFEELKENEQKELLKRYRVGTYLVGHFPDEFEETLERESYQRANEVLRWLLPVLVLVYWVGWRLLLVGHIRNAWTDGPVVMFWVLMLVLAMPQILRLWTEPDDVGESRTVSMTRS